MPANCGPGFKFVLYTADTEPRLVSALERLRAYIEDELHKPVTTEHIDILRSPERALDAKVFATPMLVKECPEPELRVIGDIMEPAKVLKTLDII